MQGTVRESAIENDWKKFGLVCEEVRLFLVGISGRSEREKWQHHELLNRAVLGFLEERKRLLAIINDFLIKKRMHDTKPPAGDYETLAEAVFVEVVWGNNEPSNFCVLVLVNNRGELHRKQVGDICLFNDLIISHFRSKENLKIPIYPHLIRMIVLLIPTIYILQIVNFSIIFPTS